MNSDRLSNLHLIPPQASGVWSTSQLQSIGRDVKRSDEVSVGIELPLFWYAPQWIRLPVDVAGALAAAVANLDVVVSALKRDVSTDDQPSELFAPVETEEDDTNRPSEYLPRITPYRAERYGLLPSDFDQTKIIDFRLAPARDVSGRMAYSPEQMRRWEQASDESPIAGGGFVATATFPTDVVSLKQARRKLDQLRRLAPTAAIFVAIDCYSLEQEISAALVAKPDGLIVRMDHPEIEGIQLAALVRKARELMDEHQCADKPLWVVPGSVSPRDIAKLIALGASAVAIDAWCNPLIDFLLQSMTSSRYERSTLNEIPAVASEHLWDDIDQVIGLASSISPKSPVSNTLGTFHSRWAKACGASLLAP